jgi:hypothetical protein
VVILSFWLMNNIFQIAPIVTISSVLGTGFVTLIFKIFEKGIDAKLQEWGIVKADKRKIADSILSICAEGEEVRYKKAPENERAIYLILNQLESSQSPVLSYFVQFYNDWITTQTISEKAESNEAQEFTSEMMKETEISRKELVKAVGKWKN